MMIIIFLTVAIVVSSVVVAISGAIAVELYCSGVNGVDSGTAYPLMLDDTPKFQG